MLDQHKNASANNDTDAVMELRSETWQRLSPAAVLYYIVKFVTGIIKNGVQTVVPLTAVVATSGDNRWFILMTIIAVGGVTMIVGALLSYLNFKFRVEGNSFLIRSGVLKRKRLTLSFDRIQNVALSEPLYFRPLGLVILTLESAGSKSEEANLAGIPRALANVIRRHVLEWKSRTQNAADAENISENNDTAAEKATFQTKELLRHPISELAKYGLSNNNTFVLAGIAAVVFSQFDKFWGTALVEDWFDVIGGVIGTGVLSIVAFILFAAVIILLLLVGASVAGAIIANYNYHLTYGDHKYHRTRGLFNREETSVPEKKIQSLRISQPIVARFLGRFHLTLQQVGFASKDGSNKKNNFIIPSVRQEFYRALTERLFQNASLLEVPLNSISRRFVSRHTLFSVGIVSVALSLTLAMPLGLAALIPMAAPVISLPVLLLRRRRYGYAMNNTHGVVRSGFLGHNLTVFPFIKVQSMEIIQSPGQRKHDLADLKITLASRALTIPYITLEHALEWRKAALLEVETNDAPWM